jgi:hypothetical protein
VLALLTAELGLRSSARVAVAEIRGQNRAVPIVKEPRPLPSPLDPHGEPNVFVLDVPYAGARVEASVFFGVSSFEARWDFD